MSVAACCAVRAQEDSRQDLPPDIRCQPRLIGSWPATYRAPRADLIVVIAEQGRITATRDICKACLAVKRCFTMVRELTDSSEQR